MIENDFTHRVEIRHGWLWPKEDKWAWELSVAEFSGLRDKMMKHVRTNVRMIQAGGCCGFYPKQWSKDFSLVYTFEPDALNFYCLNVNCGTDRIIKLQAALSDERSFCGLYHRGADNVGAHQVKPTRKRSGQGYFPTVRIDDFGFVDIGAIQLDCEGYESKIIAGAMKTIRKCRPVISIGTDGADRQLESLGYRQVDEHGLSNANPMDRIWIGH